MTAGGTRIKNRAVLPVRVRRSRQVSVKAARSRFDSGPPDWLELTPRTRQIGDAMDEATNQVEDGTEPIFDEQVGPREAHERDIWAIRMGLSALGLLAESTHCQRLDFWKLTLGTKSEDQTEMGNRLSKEAADILVRIRRTIGDLMEEIGDFQNGGDAACDVVIQATGPAYRAMHELKALDATATPK